MADDVFLAEMIRSIEAYLASRPVHDRARFECLGGSALPSGRRVVVLRDEMHGVVLWEVEAEATDQWVPATLNDMLEALEARDGLPGPARFGVHWVGVDE